MEFSRRSSAWVLAGLQGALTLFFYFTLRTALPPGMEDAGLFDGPSWFGVMVGLNGAVAAALALCALRKHEIAGILRLFAAHIVCPLLFFTDLTRNPYFTQIVLLNLWIGFVWIGWLWDGLARGSFSIPKTPLDVPFLAFLGVASLSWGLSFFSHLEFLRPAMFWEGLKAWLFLAVNCMAVFYLAAALDERWRGRFIWTTFWIAGAAAAYGLMQFYGIERIWQKTLTPFANRPVSTFGNPNFLSSYLLLVTPLLAVSALCSKKILRTAASVVLLVLVVAGIIATMTRSTWVGVLAALGMLAFSNDVRNVIRANLRRFAVFAVILAAAVFLWPKSRLGGYRNPLDRLIELKEIRTKKSYHPWHQRLLIWSSSWRMVRDHPVFGKGWGLMELFYPYYQGGMLFHPVLGQFRTHANNSHNEVMEVWSQTGTVGMAVYAWLWAVLVAYGFRLCRMESGPPPPGRSPPAPADGYPAPVWGWALTAAAVGMLVDNFFGNVSLHFAVPAFLFWWQAGLLFGTVPAPKPQARKAPAAPPHWRTFAIDDNARKSVLTLAMAFFLAVGFYNFRREFQEIFYFAGFKLSKTPQGLDLARQKLEEAWLWFPREVNSNYELANTYARLAQENQKMGLGANADAWRKKALWGYLESLRSNAGYDEIFFNLAATQSQMGWNEPGFADIALEDPRGNAARISAEETGTAMDNYSRALAINPASQDGYNFLGNVFLQNREKYQEEAGKLFEQAVHFFPENKDFWINLAFIRIQKRELEPAYEAIRAAMTLDPFYPISRRNLRALVAQLGRGNDPLAWLEEKLADINPLIQSARWKELAALTRRMTEILPGNPELRLVLANAYFELKDWPAAEKEYLAILRISPHHQTALNNLGLTYEILQRPGDARGMYETVLASYPDDANAKKRLAALPR